jgi:hypothetical protein
MTELSFDKNFQEKDVVGSFGDAQRNSTPPGKKVTILKKFRRQRRRFKIS